MAMDFTKLGAVGTVDKVLDTDTVLVERGGSIYRVAGNQLGGAGGFLLEVDAETTTWDSSNNSLIIAQDATDMIAAYQAGSHVVVNFPIAIIEDEAAGYYYPMSIVSLLDAYVMGDSDAPGMIYLALTLSELCETIYFTNGNPMPDSASTTALRLKKGAGDGES